LKSPSDLRTLRQRRERAEDWINYASWTAMGTAALTAVIILAIVTDEPGALRDAVPLLSTLFGQAAVGYKLRERSQWAAWCLLATYAVGFALSALAYGVLTGFIGKAAIGYVYVRGWLATLDYPELCKEIAALSAQSAESVTQK